MTPPIPVSYVLKTPQGPTPLGQAIQTGLNSERVKNLTLNPSAVPATLVAGVGAQSVTYDISRDQPGSLTLSRAQSDNHPLDVIV